MTNYVLFFPVHLTLTHRYEVWYHINHTSQINNTHTPNLYYMGRMKKMKLTFNKVINGLRFIDKHLLLKQQSWSRARYFSIQPPWKKNYCTFMILSAI